MVAFRSASTAGNNGDVDLTVAAPTGMAAGDLGIAMCATMGDTGAISAAGWTKLFELPFVNGPNAGEFAVFTREATGAHSAAFTWDGDFVWRHGAILAYSGYEGEEITVETFQTDGWNENITFPSIDVPTNDSLLLCLAASVGQTPPTTPPAGMTERVEFGGLYAAEEVVAAGTASGRSTELGNGGNQTNIQASIVIAAPAPDSRVNARAGGVFGAKPVLVKSDGTFVEKPVLAKSGGSFA